MMILSIDCFAANYRIGIDGGGCRDCCWKRKDICNQYQFQGEAIHFQAFGYTHHSRLVQRICTWFNYSAFWYRTNLLFNGPSGNSSNHFLADQGKSNNNWNKAQNCGSRELIPRQLKLAYHLPHSNRPSSSLL